MPCPNALSIRLASHLPVSETGEILLFNLFSGLGSDVVARAGSLTALESMTLTTSGTCAPLQLWNARVTAQVNICYTECVAAWVSQQKGFAGAVDGWV